MSDNFQFIKCSEFAKTTVNSLVLTGVASSAATPIAWLVASVPNLVKAKKGLGGIVDGIAGQGFRFKPPFSSWIWRHKEVSHLDVMRYHG